MSGYFRIMAATLYAKAGIMTAEDLFAKLRKISVGEMRKEFPYGVIINTGWTDIRCVQDLGRIEAPMTDRQFDKIANEIPEFLEKFKWVFWPNRPCIGRSYERLLVWLLRKRQDQALSMFTRGTPKWRGEALQRMITLAKSTEEVFGKHHYATHNVLNNLAALTQIINN
jgi:hypothetical protein